eukprot:m.488042 g.488042  ORF g.488042 m.488042 type:complete len:295 (-) comp21761_c0_seq7:39-923(-)
MLPPGVLGASAGIGLLAGILIGSVGVGGIIIVPSLIEFKGYIDVQTAIASSMFSYIAVGIAGGIEYTRKGSVVWPSSAWVIFGATPGGFLGAFILQFLGDLAIKLTLYVLVLLSAVYALYRTLTDTTADPPADPDRHGILSGVALPADAVQTEPAVAVPSLPLAPYRTTQGRVLRGLVGFIDGLGSALTGTSGPVILLPMLFSLSWGVLDALGSAQVVQAPIATAATVAFVTLRPGTIDFVLGGCLSAGLVPGAIIGAAIAHHVPLRKLKISVAVILVLAAGFLIGKIIVTELI